MGTRGGLVSRFIRQSGGKGQYGHVVLKLEPLPSGKGFEFVSAIKGTTIPKEFIPAIGKGVQEAMLGGIIVGYPEHDPSPRLAGDQG